MTRWASTLVVAALAAACAAPVPSAPVIDVGENEVIFRVTVAGGLPPPPELRVLEDPPQISVFGDGRVIRLSNAPIFGDPQVPTMVLAHAAREQLAELVATAQRADLLRDVRFDCPGSFDFPTTTMRSAVAGRSFVYEVYALGSDVCEGLDQAAIVGRANLGAFVEVLRALDREGEIGWGPDRLLVVVSRRAVGDGEEAETVPWPLADGPAEIGEAADPGSGWERCAILGSAETTILWPLLQAASTNTRFTRDDESWWVDARPLLPDEQPACPSS